MAVAEAKNDKSVDLFAVRSLLFLPASNPRAIAKAREAGADLVILDLEDAVKPEDKASARQGRCRGGRDILADARRDPRQWRRDRVALARPRCRREIEGGPGRRPARHLRRTSSATLPRRVGKPVLAMIETAAGVLAAAEIASECAGLIAGTNDLRADLRLPLDADARADLDRAAADRARRARCRRCGVRWRFQQPRRRRRTSCAKRRRGGGSASTARASSTRTRSRHAIEAFAPSAAEIERAQALVEAFQGGAERFGNEMIERMHVEAAQRVLDRAKS